MVLVENPPSGRENNNNAGEENVSHHVHTYGSLETNTANAKQSSAKIAPKMAVNPPIGRCDTKYPMTNPPVVNFPISIKTVTKSLSE
jgi:hypothetical protein